MEATQLCLNDRLVNPLHEPLQGHIRGKQHYPIRKVVGISDTEIRLDNGATLPKLNDMGIPCDYRLLSTVPEKYLILAGIV